MAALSADAALCSTVGPTVEVAFSANAADTYYKGSVVFIDAAGGVQLVPASGDKCLGISPKKQVIAAAGDEVQVLVWGFVWLPVGTNIAAADENDLCVLDIGSTQSDNPADFTSSGDITDAVGDLALGRIMRVTSTQMLLHIGPETGKTYSPTIGDYSYLIS